MRVTVIIPVYNAEDFIHLCLDALMVQTYSDFEIIVVDNGSHDKTCEIIRTYSNVKLYFQNDVQSSYAARNVGIKQATGELFAFTDADCIPDPDWLKNAVIFFKIKKCDLIGGHIKFIYSKKPSGAELIDSLIHMRNDKYISEEGVAATANLFVRNKIITQIGVFKDVTSGGDTLFTRKAVKQGFNLLYANNVIIEHPARSFKELLIKSYRTGQGSLDHRSSEEKITFVKLIKELSICIIIPPNPFKWTKRIQSLPCKISSIQALSAIFTLYIIQITSKIAAAWSYSSVDRSAYTKAK